MGSRLGHDFSRVRVHSNATSREATRALRARAFTVGADIVMPPEHHSPQTPSGRRLLAHELVHVAQQQSGIVPPGSLQKDADDAPSDVSASTLDRILQTESEPPGFLDEVGKQAYILIANNLKPGTLTTYSQQYLDAYLAQGLTYIEQSLQEISGIASAESRANADFWSRQLETLVKPLAGHSRTLISETAKKVLPMIDEPVGNFLRNAARMSPDDAIGMVLSALAVVILADMPLPISFRQRLGAGFEASGKAVIESIQQGTLRSLELGIAHENGFSITSRYASTATSQSVSGGISYEDDTTTAGLSAQVNIPDTGENTYTVNGNYKTTQESYNLDLATQVTFGADRFIFSIPTAKLKLGDLALGSVFLYSQIPQATGGSADTWDVGGNVTWGDTAGENLGGAYKHYRRSGENGYDEGSLTGKVNLDTGIDLAGTLAARRAETGDWSGSASVTLTTPQMSVALRTNADFAADRLNLALDYHLLNYLLYSPSVGINLNEDAVDTYGSKLTVENLAGLVPGLDVSINLQAADLIMNPHFAQAIAEVAWDSPYATIGLSGGRQTITVGEKEIESDQVNLKLEFTSEDAENLLGLMF